MENNSILCRGLNNLNSSQPFLYRLDLSYVGTKFSGFQSQADQNAIQDHLEKACKIFFRHSQRVRGASRTDRGVHAEGQVVTIRTHVSFEESRWKLGLNALLPDDIKVRRITPISGDFNPICAAKAKVYRYRLWQGNCDHPMLDKFVWSVYPPIDISILKNEAKDFIGRHDFSSFCNQGSFALTKERRILDLYIEEKGPLINIWVLGDGFLKQMVRIIVGTLVSIAARRLPTGSIPQILSAKSRIAAAQTAPACGLSLVEIFYDDIPTMQEIVQKSQQGFCISLI